MDGFVHLHVHSHYSLLDGANRLPDLVDTVKEHGSSALALTDHGNLFGALEFYGTCRANDIKPILGIEAYISPTTRTDRDMDARHASYHMLLLAMNRTGWDNIVHLSSKAFMEGFYYKPRVDRELLQQFNEGIICTSACLGGEIPQALLENRVDDAKRIAEEYIEIFGKDRFFIEVQSHNEDQARVNPLLCQLAEDVGVGVVGTNDVHFLKKDWKKAHEILTCISTGKTLADGGALEYPEDLYLKSPAEMAEAFSDLPPEAMSNTLKIAEMCNVELEFRERLPVYSVPAGETDDTHLEKLAFECMEAKFAERDDEITQEYIDRLNHELKVLRDKGYSSYFLICYDFIQYARKEGIPVNPRGSGVGTLLGYVLGISSVDPLQYGLLFERFTDPARKEAPDLDIDICQEGREQILQYVRKKYGHVAQIITYGTLKAKAAVKDVGRVLGMPLPDVDRISKHIPDGPKVKLGKAIKEDPDLKQIYDRDPAAKEVLDYAQKLEGLARHSGVHACGVIICDEPLDNFLPLYRTGQCPDAISQWDGPTSEQAGAMKMDFLGLRTLTIMRRARDLILQRTGKDIDPEKLPLDDRKVFELFCNGQTDGVFQFESDGMKNVLMQMKPDRIEVLIAANAMYRPGPMELIPSYCARKDEKEEVPSVHELVDDILAETYGIMAYQEQVMLVLNRLGKLPLNRALTLIKAISKKKEKVIAGEKPNFIKGAIENGISEAEAENLFGLILKFAGYGFNKSHSTMYALVAYRMAYYKTHYPREFLAATLTYECSDTAKVVQYMSEAERLGVTVAPPDINVCGKDFSIDGDQVRFGLAGVKGVGEKAIEAILEARKELEKTGETFLDLYHFCENVDLRAVNRSTIEALIKCGAFDALGAHRGQMMAGLDHAIEAGQNAAEERKSGQMNIFNMMEETGLAEKTRPTFPDVEPWSESQLLQAEKDTLGFYVTSHPLVKYGRELNTLSQPPKISLSNLEDYGDGTPVNIGCMISQVRLTVVKNGKSAGRRMAMLTLEDLTGKTDAVVFSDAYDEFREYLQTEAIVFVSGLVDRRREKPSIIIKEITPIDDAVEKFTASVLLRLPAGEPNPDLLGGLKNLLETHKGDRPIFLEVTPTSRADIRTTIRLGKGWTVAPNRSMLVGLLELMEEERIRLQPCPLKVEPRRQWKGKLRGGPAQGQKGRASEAVTRFN
ncbi:MAG: DNA polymerase III subunit alpha [Phycisphaerae bacterium]